MSYTVTEAYNRVLEEADKIGSDYYTLPQVLKAFKKETLNFIGERAKEVESSQEVTDDIRSLVESKLIPFIINPDNPLERIASLPNDYHTKLTINVLYSDGLKARKPLIERHGETNTNTLSPFKKADRMYPVIQQFSNYFNIKTGLSAGSPIQPDKLILIYLKEPTFGKLQSDIIVNLPDQVCELLFSTTANSFLVNTGDIRAELDYKINQNYRK
jgi:hypothetical protein